MIILGIDPGLGTTGLALVRHTGPGQPDLLAHGSARVDDGPDRADRMLEAIAKHIHATLSPADLIAIESFAHRSYLTTTTGNPRPITTSPDMGRLIGRLIERLTHRTRARVVEVSPVETKRGYPRQATHLARLLPPALANRHERDAYLAASFAAAIRRIREPNHTTEAIR
jgi:hypothetical protein